MISKGIEMLYKAKIPSFDGTARIARIILHKQCNILCVNSQDHSTKSSRLSTEKKSSIFKNKKRPSAKKIALRCDTLSVYGKLKDTTMITQYHDIINPIASTYIARSIKW